MNIIRKKREKQLSRIIVRILFVYLLSSLIVIYLHNTFLHLAFHDDNMWLIGKFVEIGLQLILASPFIFLYVSKYRRDIDKIETYEKELDNKDAQYRYLMESLPDAVMIYSKDEITFVNNVCVQMMGVPDKKSLIGADPYQILYKNRSGDTKFTNDELLFTPSNGIEEQTFVLLDGSSLEVEYVKIIVNFNGEKAILIIARDVSERNKTNKKLATASSLLDNIVNSIDASIYSVDIIEEKFIFTSEAYIRDFGSFNVDGIRLDGWRESIVPEDIAKADQFSANLMSGLPAVGEFRHRKSDGSIHVFQSRAVPVKDEKGNIYRIDGVNTEVTDIISAQERIEFLAFHDDLTGIANRRLYRNKLREAAEKAVIEHRKFAIVFLDLDKFKNINDSLGHYAGDAFLKEVAQRLSSSVHEETDTVARIGGDEFTLIYHYTDNHELIEKIEEIQNRLHLPFIFDGYEFIITTSMGISLFPDDGTSLDMLMNFADNAMFQAKQSRNGFCIHNRDAIDNNLERIHIQSELPKAIVKQEFSVVYQPKHHLSDHRLIGAEALIRWKHPEMGHVSPAKFIPIAEEMGLIHSIGEWVLIQVCEQIKRWESLGFQFPVSVNLSVHQFRDERIVENIQGIIERFDIKPSLLELEITESMAMDIQKALPILEALSHLGVLISIDDFGTGYSSLNYLKNLPVHQLKIDKSFVDDIMLDSWDAAIISTVVTLAHNLNMKVIAEGVETADQAEKLHEMNCDEAQGYYFHKPLQLEEFNDLLKSIGVSV